MRTTARDGASRRVPVYILAGGRSRRFGEDKARYIGAGGRPLILDVARMVEAVATETTVVAARPGQYEDLGLRTIGDVVEAKGPLGGLLTALEDRERWGPATGWLFLVACDWVGARAAWLDLLLYHCAGGQAVVFSGAQRDEPAFALYHSSIIGLVRERMELDRLDMQSLLESAQTTTVPLPSDWNLARNLNEPPQP